MLTPKLQNLQTQHYCCHWSPSFLTADAGLLAVCCSINNIFYSLISKHLPVPPVRFSARCSVGDLTEKKDVLLALRVHRGETEFTQ